MEVLLKVGDVARMLNAGIRTVFRMRDSGAIVAPLKVAGTGMLRWRKADIEAWISAGTPDCARTGWRPSADAGSNGGKGGVR